MGPSFLVVAYTGHRRLADEAVVAAAIERVLDRLSAQARDEGAAIVGIGSAAIGADTLVLEALKRRGAANLLKMPFAAERFETDAPSEQRQRCMRLIEMSNAVEYVTIGVVTREHADTSTRQHSADRPHPDPPPCAALSGEGSTGLTESEAYLEAGLQTIEPADVLVAVWDGEPAQGQGGTAEIVAAARALGLEIVRIDPRDGAVEWATSQHVNKSTSQQTEQVSFSRDPESAEGSAVETSQHVNTSTRQQAEKGRNETSRISEGESPAPLGRAAIERMFKSLDGQATQNSPMARLLLFRVIVLHLLASAVAISAVMAQLHGWAAHVAAAFKLGVLLWALVLATAQRRRSRAWLDARYRAEVCRSFLALWPIRRDAVPMLPGASTVSTREFHRDLEMAWRLHASEAEPIDAARARYLKERLIDQKEWLASKGRQSSSLMHKLHRLGVGITTVAIVFAAAAMLLGLLHLDEGFYRVAKTLAIVLPLAAATVFSLSVSHDLARRADRYTELAERLKVLERRVKISETWPTLGRAVAQTEALLLDELGEWHAMMRFAGRPH